MKKILILLSATTILACNSSKEKQSTIKTTETVSFASKNNKAEKMNETVPYEESVMILGKANRAGLQNEAFKDWFGPGYESYNPDSGVVEKLKPLLKDVQITVFMGTWCEDSHREVPYLYKVLDKTGYDESQLTVIAVSEEKTTPQGFEESKNITHVPTIIFYKDEVEMGRIVEFTIQTLEQDMLAILSGADYKNPYSE